jgi:hypothetical protein
VVEEREERTDGEKGTKRAERGKGAKRTVGDAPVEEGLIEVGLVYTRSAPPAVCGTDDSVANGTE